jgi:hypothetical protein
MQKFQVTVTRVDTYIVELDENIFNQSWLDKFKTSFYDLQNLKGIAEYLGCHQARFGQKDGFIEGFGYVTRDGYLPYLFKDHDSEGNPLPESEYRKAVDGLNIIIDDEDNDIETEVITIPELNSNSTDEKTA